MKNKDKTNNSMSHYRTFEQAQEYIAKGFSVIPLRPKGKKPALDSWKEFQKRRPSGEELKKWFSNGSSNNIAIVTGSLSGIVVIDLDTLEAVQFAKENRFPATPTVKTGNGFHGYFLYREGIRSESGGKVFPGLHVKSEGGMATAPPSIHENGLPYEWVAGRGLDDIPFAPLPEIIVKKLLQRPPDRTPLREAYKGVDQGNRNDTLARLCGSWVNDGLTFQECMETATTWNERNNPPLPAREIETTVKSIFEKHHREKTKGIPIEPGINLTDLGNARRFVIAHAPDLRYCFPWGKWLAWDGRRWKIDDTGEPHRRAKDTIRRIYAEARDSRDEDERKRLATHALRSESDSKIKAMLSLAQSEPGIPILPDEMDSDPWVLNLANGTLELKTGILKPHRREDLITRLAPVEFRPETACPFWLEHLDRIFQKNPGLISFLQIAFGYSLTGLTDQRVLFIAHGAGANGKTTTQEVFAQILGDYAVRTPTESILVKRDAGIPNDLAKLKGARFVYCSEVEEGKRLAESLIKDLTGNDTISARFMRGEWFTFQPSFKLWLATNHKPIIRGTDNAIWSRIRLIPFTVSIPECDRIPRSRMMERLTPELPGILAWSVQGCLDWRRFGLGAPDEVKEATDSYRGEMDVIGGFINECCLVSKNCSAMAKDLYTAYTKWAEDSGEKAVSHRMFGLRLAERGLRKERVTSGYRWTGIGLEDDLKERELDLQ